MRQFTWSYLESLATPELIALADGFGIDVPPDLERNFIIEELLEVEEERDQEENLEEASVLEPAQLPKQYNLTFINALIRDPLWVFVFWEIKGADKEIFEKADDFEGYFLRVTGISREISFTVPVGVGDNSWYLGFPPSGGSFYVEICVSRRNSPGENDTTVLGVSSIFELPQLFNGVTPETAKNPLALLSGLEDFTILRNEERLSLIPEAIG